MTDVSAAPVRGVAVREAARAGARGRVVSVHRKAVYLDLDRAVVALVSAGVEPGPLHLCSGPLPPAVAGERLNCDGSRIAGRAWAVRCDVALWEGVLPDRWPAATDDGGGQDTDPDPDPGANAARPDRRHRAETGAGAVVRPGHGVAPAGLPATAIPDVVPVDDAAIRRAVRAGAVEELAALLGGLGPGLTPAGDDLLAGLVLAARARWGSTAEGRLRAAVDGVRTTRPARAFLHWAARGQSLAPAHDVLAALAAGGPDAGAAARLEGIGASSGRCLLAGLRIGVAQLPRLDTQSTRAGSGVAL